MDAPEDERDIKLQKISADLIADIDRSLASLLHKKGSSGTRPAQALRSYVRTRDIVLLAALLDTFQELPQLLDSRLPKWIPTLGEAYLASLRNRHGRQYSRPKGADSRDDLLTPLPAAICRLLYTLCKVRGEKVIVRFLSVEVRNLEVLLAALEEAEEHVASPSHIREPYEKDGATSDAKDDTTSVRALTSWTWEQRYLTLLWLSHLLLAPFDLASISSLNLDIDEDTALPSIPGFVWPAGLPGITARLLPLGIKYLAVPGKERDSARALLVRMAMRRDMQQLGLLAALVRWAIATLGPSRGSMEVQTPYFYIGRLSFLAGILAASSDTSDMDPYLRDIYYTTHAIASSTQSVSSDSSQASTIVSSALARKTLIKVLRSITVLILRKQDQDMADTELIETTIGYLLESLGDNDTPVRLAASKALSVVTLKLEPDMALQVVEAVLEGLQRNVVWTKDGDGKKRDLRSVNPQEWHGLILTLSHLLYRRSPPAESIGDIVQSLLLGLAFEQRNATGASVGSNVRDAACFGVWALARRYSTEELVSVSSTTLQTLATALVVTASLDPAGNIRRGASAALQELIGRHPDTITEGISVVQTVDYHAVALRSRAVGQVAWNATKLAPIYGRTILEGLLGWRGVGDGDAASRRVAARAFGDIAGLLAAVEALDDEGKVNLLGNLTVDFERVNTRLGQLADRQVEEKQGLILALAATLDQVPAAVRLVLQGVTDREECSQKLAHLTLTARRALADILQRVADQPGVRRPDLTAEAICDLIVAMFPLFQAAPVDVRAGWEASLVMLSGILTKAKSVEAITPVRFAETALVMELSADGCRFVNGQQSGQLADSVLELITKHLTTWLSRPEKEAIDAVSRASLIMLALSPMQVRLETIKSWAEAIRQRGRIKFNGGKGHFFALTQAYKILSSLPEPQRREYVSLICDAVLERWRVDKEIETRVAILESLTGSLLLQDNVDVLVGMIEEGLDDYTTNARGDVGSHVRLQALRATRELWRSSHMKRHDEAEQPARTEATGNLLPKVLRLSVEKLDRVRVEARMTLSLALRPGPAEKLRELTFSSEAYFTLVLSLLQDGASDFVTARNASSPQREANMRELLAGYVTSSDTGNEDLVIASRNALASFCETTPSNLHSVCSALAQNLKDRAEDRVLVPTLEVIAFLFYAGIFERAAEVVDLKGLCLRVQRAHYKTGNVRKLEACVKVYGAIVALAGPEALEEGEASNKGNGSIAEAVQEARKRLGGLLLHPWPRVRSLVVDELWALPSAAGRTSTGSDGLKGVDWGRADKQTIKKVADALQLS